MKKQLVTILAVAGISTSAMADVTLQFTGGSAMISGPIAEEYKSQDVNPKNLSYNIADANITWRIALGYTWDKWELQAGYGRIGSYNRTLKHSDPGDDTVGDITRVSLADLRLIRYFTSWRLQPYLFGETALAYYDRSTWKGHKVVGGVSVCVECSDSGWKNTKGYTPELGIGAGLKFRYSDDVSLLLEARVLEGDIKSQSLQAGLKVNF